jgi:hypothetical protein
MNKKTIAIIVFLVVLVVIVGVIGFNHRAKAPEVQSVGVSTSTATQATSTTTTTLGSPTVTVVLSTSTTKTYSGSSFSFNYPSSWSILSAKPLMMTNFNGQYKANGVIPAGGAQLGVVTTTVGGSVADIMTTELMSAKNLTTSTVAVDNVSCAKATYQVSYAPGATAQNISLYCLRGSELWKIYFSYPAGDAAEKADIPALDGILSSMKFL